MSRRSFSLGATLRLLARGWACILLPLTACNLVVDTDYLVAGKDGLACLDDEKICPVSSEDPDGIQECVEVSNPETGCARSSCSPCQVPGAVARCTSDGTCGVSVCSDAHQDCDENEANGCEIDTASSLDNCGACGQLCERNNAVTSCVQGVCVFVICSPPFGNCDNNGSNGCETNLDSDSDHCGACDTPCAGTCQSGTCVP